MMSSSPYRSGAMVSTLNSIPSGLHLLTDDEYNTLIDIFVGFPLAEADIDDLQDRVTALEANSAHPVYEPVCDEGEILFDTNGDCLMEWGGYYAA